MADLTRIAQPIDQDLLCEYTLQHSEGYHIANTRGILRGRVYKVTYDLMLCRFCGNLEGSPNNLLFCPEKIRQRLLSDGETKKLQD